MSLGVGIFLAAVGAVLAFGVEVDVRGLDLDAVGVILMLVGILVAAISALWFTSWAPLRREVVEREVVYDDDPVVRRAVEPGLDEPVARRRRVRRTYRSDVA
jgi:hypothetical protein